MEPVHIGLLGIVVLLVLIFLRVPISFALAGVGTIGLLHLNGLNSILYFIPHEVYSHTAVFTFAAIPLFLLMGYLGFYADLSKDSYDVALAWFGKVPGGLAVATVYACALFGACSGSSLAECAVFSKISVPEMTSRNYDKRLALGVVAAAGGLDVLIPPSVLMVVYGVMTETSIGWLLIAGILPGILYALVFTLGIIIFVYFKPSFAPQNPDMDTSWKARIDTLKRVWAIFLIIGLVLGAIFFGWATPDEAAAVGVFGSFLLVLWRRKYSWSNFKEAAVGSAKASAMIFLLFGAASIFTGFLVSSGVITGVTLWIKSINPPFWGIMIFIIVIYLIMGCFLDAISMMILTLPIVVPMLEAHGANLVWFGVIVCMLCVIGCITPPMGLNVYVMKAAMGDEVELNDIFAGALPFGILMLLVTIILCFFPQVSLWLPNLMAGK